MQLQQLEDSDWAHLHDCWLHAKGTKPTREQLEKLVKNLPEDTLTLAVAYGMNDTVFREDVIEWILSNEFTED